MGGFRTSKRAKCPNCLPDSAGAIFTLWGSDAWKCNNCGHTLPRRTNKPTPKITASQQRVLDTLTRYGWKLETKFIGRGLWVVGRKDRGNEALNLYVGDSFYGNVGPRGSFSFKLQRFGGDKELTDEIGLEVYLK